MSSRVSSKRLPLEDSLDPPAKRLRPRRRNAADDDADSAEGGPDDIEPSSTLLPQYSNPHDNVGNVGGDPLPDKDGGTAVVSVNQGSEAAGNYPVLPAAVSVNKPEIDGPVLLFPDPSKGRLSYCDTKLVNRLRSITNFSDRKRGIYAVQNAPRDANWGVPSAFNNTASILCHKGTSFPVTLWIVGEMAESWFFDRDGEPAARVTTAILPLDPDIRRICAEQIRTLLEPRLATNGADKWGPEQIKASRWMNRAPKRNQPAGPRTFDDIYDASDRLRDKASMLTLSAEELSPHDLVLLEVGICRYRFNKDDAADASPSRPSRAVTGRRQPNSNTGGWTSWVAYYELKAVYMLQTVPDDFRSTDGLEPENVGLEI